MKKLKKPSDKVLRQNNPPSKKILFGTIASIVSVIILLAIVFFIHKKDNDNPYLMLKGYESSRHGFMVKSSEISLKIMRRALQALKEKRLNEAIGDCKTAIDIFPINAQPYILLTKIYLMTGQEQKVFETLSLAGHSYPDFDNIVSIIDDENFAKIPLDEPQNNIFLANFPEYKKMAMTFMFDDGEASVYDALPTFEKYGFRATIPVVAGFVAENDSDPFWGSWQEWKDAANRGFEIANHSMYHRDSKELHGSDFDVSIDQSKELIEKKIGHEVTTYVFPHDSYTDEAVSRALKGHKAVRTPEFLHPVYDKSVEIVYGGPHFSVETADRLVDIGINRRLWLIMTCHGVTAQRTMRSFKSITPSFLEAHLSYIHSRSNDIWVDTFSNIFEYMSSRTQTKIETKNFSADYIDFVLHNNKSDKKLSTPLTVVLKIQEGVKVKAAHTSNGHRLKAWSCAFDKVCVDVDIYEEDVRVEWGKVA